MRRYGWIVAVACLLGLASCACWECITGPNLPDLAREALLAKFPSGQIEDVDIEMEDGREIYEVEVEVGDKEYEVTVLADGTILKTELEEDDEDDEDEDED